MHELAVCEALIDQVEAVARAEHANAVSDIYVSIGPLSGIEHPLMRNAFPIAAAGSIAERAELHLEIPPVRVRCSACGRETEVPVNRLVCGHCGEWRTQLVSGDEMLLLRVVMDKESQGVRANV